MTLPSRRSEEPAICTIHNETMIRYDGDCGQYSYGCESCVKPMREYVRKLRDDFKARMGKKGFACVSTDTGLKRTG